MPQERPCPFRDRPATEGGHMDANVGEEEAPLFEFGYTPVQGTGDPSGPCAFRLLSQQALAHQKIDSTQACRQCARVIGVHSVK